MNRSDRRFLQRLKAEARRVDIEPAVHRSYLRLRVELCAGLRMMLLSLGIDPAGVRCLRYGERAAAELAAIPDTPELEQADDDLLAADEAQTPPSGSDPWDHLLARLEHDARYWAESGRTPDFSSEPLQTVLAWCLAQDTAGAAWAEPAGPEAAEQAVAAPHPNPLPASAASGERESEAKPETGAGEDSSEADLRWKRPYETYARNPAVSSLY